MSETECPTCGRDDFASKRGVKQHHARTHGESLRFVEKSCQVCGELYEIRKDRAGHSKCCSQSCSSTLIWENYDNKEETYTCKNCGDDYDRLPSENKRGEQNFCSRDCWHNYAGGETAPNWQGGADCDYAGGWKRKRVSILERDDYQCRACGITEQQHKEDTGKGLDVHHVIPVRLFDDLSEAHAKENLVTACRSCHMKWEGLPVFPT